MSAFFNCVLDATIENCSSIATSQNFYKKCITALHIVEIGSGQYKLTDSWVKQKIGLCDNATRQLNGLSNKLSTAITDAGITSKNLANAQAAYNLANFVRDTKRAVDRGDLTQVPGVRLAITAFNSAEDFGKAVSNCIKKIADTVKETIVSFSFEDILENMFADEDGLYYYVKVTDQKIYFDGNDGFNYAKPDSKNYSVSQKDSAVAADTLNRIYLTNDHRLVSNAYIVDAMNGEIELDPKNDDFDLNKKQLQALVNEITTKAGMINDLSDITQYVKKF